MVIPKDSRNSKQGSQVPSGIALPHTSMPPDLSSRWAVRKNFWSSSVICPGISVTCVSHTTDEVGAPILAGQVRAIGAGRFQTAGELVDELALGGLNRAFLHVERFVRAVGEGVLRDVVRARAPVPHPISTMCTRPWCASKYLVTASK